MTTWISLPYVPPLGTPLYWGDEVSGELARAIRALYDAMIDHTPLLPTQLEIVRHYCAYVINAPCWDEKPHHDEDTRARLRKLRDTIKLVTKPEELDAWIDACLEEGIDPLSPDPIARS